ncbi:hypothetical protein SAMN05660649_05020 [Desulfotomaculum arcticum]|uniref:Metal-sensitive transcriptional repressor n=1 Tax=Desulfotruncus arcticus DSM 17038 TaxID=1121424 RepID=A0A1I2ZMT2_9FIRM|nr:hypothetical protein SAMN05660649_05020 [Desulfotomaculum arcticum] [Desulfotruncus arcticus DSM 17038]
MDTLTKQDNLQSVLEDIRNHLTVLKGLVQISSNKQFCEQTEVFILESVNNANNLITEALVLINKD